MSAGEYPQPLLRNQFIQAPMVSGYTTVRLSTTPALVNTSGLDNTILVLLENVGNTSFAVKINQTVDPSVSGLRTTVVNPVSLVPGGRSTVTFYPSAQFLEFATTSGGGKLRAQLTSRQAWSEMAFSKTDPFYPAILWQVDNGLTFNQLNASGS